jgi:hypothetical protein
MSKGVSPCCVPSPPPPFSFWPLPPPRPQDAAILAERLQSAAHEVCAKTNDASSSVRKILMRRCVEQAVSKATSQIWAEIESSPHRAIRANLMSVRQQVASADMP